MNFIRLILSSIISFSLIFSNIALAGDIMPQGTVLEEDSYVFTVEEATALMRRVQELEEKELELEKYKELEAVRQSQIDLFTVNEEFYTLQIDRYKQLDITNQALIDRYQRRDRFQGIENAGFFVLGMAITFGSIAAANAIVANQSNNLGQVSF